jgi:hypothetical protein
MYSMRSSHQVSSSRASSGSTMVGAELDREVVPLAFGRGERDRVEAIGERADRVARGVVELAPPSIGERDRRA